MHDARVRGGKIVKAAEDLYAETKAEAAAAIGAGAGTAAVAAPTAAAALAKIGSSRNFVGEFESGYGRSAW